MLPVPDPVATQQATHPRPAATAKECLLPAAADRPVRLSPALPTPAAASESEARRLRTRQEGRDVRTSIADVPRLAQVIPGLEGGQAEFAVLEIGLRPPLTDAARPLVPKRLLACPSASLLLLVLLA